MDVAIAGGGLAGLVAARHLADAGLDVTLFEERAELGGRVRSAHEDGFTFDRGFQVLFDSYPAVRRELDLDALDLRCFSPGAVVARPNHRATLSDPFRDPGSLVETVLTREVTLRDKLRIATLRRELAGTGAEACLDGRAESIREYLERRGFSDRFLDRFAAPFYGGITLDRSLGTDSGVFRYTFKMLTEGRACVPAAGMGAIPEQLAGFAREAGATLETEATVESVHPDAEGAAVEVDGETLFPDAVVVATDPRTAADLTGVEAVPTEGVGCVTQYFGTDAGSVPDTGRKLLLNAAGDRPNTVAPLSSVAPEYAPEGRGLLSATTLGVPDADDEALAADAREALASWYPERLVDDLELLHTDRVPFAQFAQPPGFRASLPSVEAPDGPVYLAGDYTNWSSIQGAMESGRTAAGAVRGRI